MLTKQLFALRMQIHKLTLRERIILLVSLFFAVLLMAQGGLWLTDLANHDKVEQRISVKQQEAVQYEESLAGLKAAINNPRIQSLTDSNDELKIQIEKLRANIDDINSKLMSPDRMVALLKELLDGQSKLALQRFKVDPVIAIDSNLEGGTLFYRHGLTIELEGDFESLVTYLEKIEALPTQLFWDVLDINTDRFPRLNIQIKVHTLSQSEEWLNV